MEILKWDKESRIVEIKITEKEKKMIIRDFNKLLIGDESPKYIISKNKSILIKYPKNYEHFITWNRRGKMNNELTEMPYTDWDEEQRKIVIKDECKKKALADGFIERRDLTPRR